MANFHLAPDGDAATFKRAPKHFTNQPGRVRDGNGAFFIGFPGLERHLPPNIELHRAVGAFHHDFFFCARRSSRDAAHQPVVVRQGLEPDLG